MKSLSLIVTVFIVVASASAASDGAVDPMATVGTSTYEFDARESTVIQTGGFAGFHRVYSIKGQIQLTVDPNAGTASFRQVDANATDDSSFRHALDLNETFNMTGLTGTVSDDGSICFEGDAYDGSSVLVTLVFEGATIHLRGETVPPLQSADFFLYELDAAAQRKYAGGTGEPDDPYRIGTAEQMNAIGAEPNDWDKHFKLMADIDLATFAKTELNVIGCFQNARNYRAFTGVFDGGGHRVLNFGYRSSVDDAAGLFGFVSGTEAKIENVILVDPNIDAQDADTVGLLVGYLQRGTVSNCHAINGRVSGHFEVGGLVGLCANGTIVNSSAESHVQGKSGVGGLVGDCEYGKILQCRSAGTVVSHDLVGGLVGGADLFVTVTNSYSNADVSGDLYVGGLAGSLAFGSVANCYSTGAVSGGMACGGLIGFRGNMVGDPSGKVIKSFWDINTSGQSISAGGTGLTTVEMQTASTFLAAGWDFVGETTNGTEDLWWIQEGLDYPRLAWERPVSDDFADGEPGPLWTVYAPEPTGVWVEETGGRLNVRATAWAGDVDAGYISNGWWLDTTRDFALRVNYHFSEQGMGDSWLLFMLVPSFDEPINRYVKLETGCLDDQTFFCSKAIDGLWRDQQCAERIFDNGTLYMSYAAVTDELYLSFTGCGKANAWQTIAGVLKGRWGSLPVHVAIGGGSDGVQLDPGAVWLDDFAVDAGAIVR